MFYKNPYYDPTKPHHTKKGFENLEPTPILTPSELWQWYRDAKRLKLPCAPLAGYESFQQQWVIKPDFTQTGNRAWWLFHSTILFRMNGHYILTDPVFSKRCSPFRFAGPMRKTIPLFTLNDLPPIHIILITHNHYDHLDKSTIKWFIQRQPSIIFIVPLGLKRWLKRLGAQHIVELDWWDEYNHNDTTITAVPARHWSKRYLWDTKRSLWCGYMLSFYNKNIYVAGDTAYSTTLKIIGERFDIDHSFLPIGAFEPRQYMKDQHTSPQESLTLHRLIHSQHFIPIHWGTFELANDGLDRAITVLKEEVKTPQYEHEHVTILKMGESISL